MFVIIIKILLMINDIDQNLDLTRERSRRDADTFEYLLLHNRKNRNRIQMREAYNSQYQLLNQFADRIAELERQNNRSTERIAELERRNEEHNTQNQQYERRNEVLRGQNETLERRNELLRGQNEILERRIGEYQETIRNLEGHNRFYVGLFDNFRNTLTNRDLQIDELTRQNILLRQSQNILNRALPEAQHVVVAYDIGRQEEREHARRKTKLQKFLFVVAVCSSFFTIFIAAIYWFNNLWCKKGSTPDFNSNNITSNCESNTTSETNSRDNEKSEDCLKTGYSIVYGLGCLIFSVVSWIISHIVGYSS